MPVYNEEKTLEQIVNRVLEVKFPYKISRELIIVNDCSKDNSASILSQLQSKHKEIKVLTNEKNLGKSQSVKKGILETTGDFVVIQDADLEYDPKDVSTLIKTAVDENLDAVYGNRFNKDNKIVIYWKNYIGNRALSMFSNLFTYFRFKVSIPDMEVCYKLVKGDIFRNIASTLVSKSMFGFEPEVTAKLSKYKVNGKHIKLKVLPISYFPRTIEEGKKMKAFQDGAKALIEILKFNIFN